MARKALGRNKKVHLTTTINPSLRKRADRLAFDSNESLSGLIERLLIAELEKLR